MVSVKYYTNYFGRDYGQLGNENFRKVNENMFKFECDITQWYFPICFHYQTVGNNHRPYNLQIGFLCFNFIICIDEYSR